jgi:hypothetical protein
MDDIQESEDVTIPPAKVRKRNNLKARRRKKLTMRKTLFSNVAEICACNRDTDENWARGKYDTELKDLLSSNSSKEEKMKKKNSQFW